MQTRIFSIRTSIRYIIGLMGVLAMVLVLMSVNWYRDLVFNEHRHSLSMLMGHVTIEQLEHYESYLFELGVTMQADTEFRSSYKEKDIERLKLLINDQFMQYFTTTGQVDLRKIVIYDASFNMIAESDHYKALKVGEGVCVDLVKQAKVRKGAQRLKNLSGMCQYTGQPHYMVIVPIGGLKVVGYAAVIASPIIAIKPIQDMLGMPLRIILPSSKEVYRSSLWPVEVNSNDLLSANHTVTGEESEQLFTISMVADVSALNEQLMKVAAGISLVALAMTAAAIIFTMLVMRKTITEPLIRLNRHIGRVRENKEYLGEKVEIHGCRELSELANEFNDMAEKLVSMQMELEQKAHTDELTGLPNRALFYDRMEQLVEINRRQNSKFALFMIDLNKFKDINDTLGHHAGDELLRQVGARLQQRLRISDTVARFGGDEFAILLPTVDSRDEAVDLASKIVEIGEKPYYIEGHDMYVGMSIGIALFPDTANDPDYLMRCADKGMYYAKSKQLGSHYCEQSCWPSTECELVVNNIPR